MKQLSYANLCMSEMNGREQKFDEVIREGFWDEHIRYVDGTVVYAYNWFVRHCLRLIHGRENRLT